MENYLTYIEIINIIVPIFILLIGITGNCLGFILSLEMRKHSIKPALNPMYKYLFISDSLFLIHLIFFCLKYAFNYDINKISQLSCKLVHYSNYSMSTISPMILVYISIERMISVKCFNKYDLVFRKPINQIAFLIVIILLTFSIYIPTNFLFEMNSNNTACDFSNMESKILILNLDLLSRVLVPFLFMLVSSLCLICLIFKTKLKFKKSTKMFKLKQCLKEIKLSISLLILNLVHLIFNLPYSLVVFTDESYYVTLAYVFTSYLFYFNYAVNFYVLFATNALFRKRFFSLFKVNWCSSSCWFVARLSGNKTYMNKTNRIQPRVIPSMINMIANNAALKY